ncbi:4-alpha-glucanotransferase [Candidatus Accumulibacter contiguus]|jgi:4-alpha-glucanotransferase|uniref:4-alpha-glucanotransferase n=1 Tax=Candidatus Accumulibacter contiguus TaxID=2954381 RepID=A0ABX1TC89_9PROT|nr:4-alpha-glucanotransferase [Candidatus Accumulibacter contiguus]MBL8407525.1 4-alpha-glucanotransferase [Accumulibacter sp.]NMQ07309.1 4-alpha-glucanotransferase [Candidatus Accumulibacter contiguus]
MTTSLPRHNGILLHPTSLPGPHGSGDLGPAAYHFVDWLVGAGQSVWQVLPLGSVGPGNSPYISPSAFAGNELLIDLCQLRDAGWISEADLRSLPAFSTGRVDYDAVRHFRIAHLRRAAKHFFSHQSVGQRLAFEGFCAAARGWLDDYALFMALDIAHGGDDRMWQDWPAPLAQRQPAALIEARRQHAEEIDFWKFCQWRFFEQWSALKHYANARHIELVGDLPIFVAAHSADVWANPQLFDLDKKGHPRVVAGVPPDYFSATGQRWGNPLYRWSAHAAEDYRWWVERMRQTMRLCDVVRIDHFRGFESFWEIPAAAKTAVNGIWRPGPGEAVFNAMRRELSDAQGRLRIIAEDLGIITPAVNALRLAIGLPGMRILQFAFDGDAKNPYLPHNYEANTVVYTGTHDNDTSRGWWESLSHPEQDYVRSYLGVGDESSEEIHWQLIRLACSSVASLCVIPMQDVLGLDSTHRMNAPGLGEGSWEWRFSWQQVDDTHSRRLAELARLYGRRRA